MEKLENSNSEELTLQAKGYRLLKKLGEGSYAKVYLADFWQASKIEKSQLACKIVDTRKAPKDFTKKFLPRELDVLVRLNHPYIIHVHSIFMRKYKYFIFMRFAEQGDLLEYVSKRGVISEPQARVWFRQMALATQYLHNIDIAHRDLKCENALITNNFNIKLADFGFARFVIDSNGKYVTSETYCGSLSYAAPEILHGTPYQPKTSDVWSLGVILYVMLNKAMPFDDNNPRRLYEQQMAKRWRFRSKIVDVLTEKVKNLMALLLDPDSMRRIKIDQVVICEWIGMDSRLLDLNEAERAAMMQAIEVKRQMKTKAGAKKENKTTKEDLQVLKEASKTVFHLSDTMAPDSQLRLNGPATNLQSNPTIKRSILNIQLTTYTMCNLLIHKKEKREKAQITYFDMYISIVKINVNFFLHFKSTFTILNISVINN